MSLPQFQSNDKDFQLLQNTWGAQLNPLLANPMAKGSFLKGISLAVGDNTINHKLGRQIQGYIITGMRGAFSQIFDATSTMPKLTLVLNSSAITEIDLYVY